MSTKIAKDKQGFTIESAGKNAGKRLPSQHNIYLALRLLKIRVAYDQFADRAHIAGLEEHGIPTTDPYLDDAKMTALRLFLELKLQLYVQKEYFCDVVTNYARSNSTHPVRGYLDRMQGKWDKVGRIDRWLIDYCGAADSPFNRAAGRLWMIAAVRRIRKPGVKFDELLTLESPQGMEKSSMLTTLAVEPQWFTDAVPLNADPKRVIEQTRGKWIVEVSELQGMTKAEIEHVKAFLSRQTDSARAAYGRLTEHVDRSFICAGTTNSERYLRDLTGNRRFWPVMVGRVALKKLMKDRDQLWGEAAALEAKGESIRLDPALWGAAAEVQAARRVINPFLDVLAKALEGVEAGRIVKADIYRLAGLQTGQLHQGNLELIGDAMRSLGWSSATPTINGKTARGFVKGATHGRPLLETYWSEVERCFKVMDPASPSAKFVKPTAAEPAQGSDGDVSAEQGPKVPEPTTVH